MTEPQFQDIYADPYAVLGLNQAKMLRLLPDDHFTAVRQQFEAQQKSLFALDGALTAGEIQEKLTLLTDAANILLYGSLDLRNNTNPFVFWQRSIDVQSPKGLSDLTLSELASKAWRSITQSDLGELAADVGRPFVSAGGFLGRVANAAPNSFDEFLDAALRRPALTTASLAAAATGMMALILPDLLPKRSGAPSKPTEGVHQPAGAEEAPVRTGIADRIKDERSGTGEQQNVR